MRLTRIAASICALCLMTGVIIYGGIFLWPRLAGSTPSYEVGGKKSPAPEFAYSIGDATGPQRPNCAAVDKDGRVYVTDSAAGKVFVFGKNGKKIMAFGSKGSGAEDFEFPNGILVTRDGNLLISDSANKDIKLFSSKGKFIKIVYKEDNVTPGYLSRGKGEEIYVSDLAGNKILVMNEKGKVLRTIQDEASPLKYPQATALDKEGRLWVADSGNYAIKIFQSGKVVQTITGGGSTKISFSMVRGIAFDQSGKAYVADTISHHIRVFDEQGKQLYVFPNEKSAADPSGSNNNNLVYPTSLSIDQNKLFVVDRGTAGVKVFKMKQ